MRRLDLVADCGSCAAICCIALPFDASEDFAFDKPAEVACRHLRDRLCAVHAERVERGLSGCTLYDCYGAGPRVTRAFGDARQGHEAFLVAREIHELLFLLTEAAKLCPQLAGELADAIAALDAITTFDVDLRAHHDRARVLLRRVGKAIGGREGLRRLPIVA